MGAPFLLGWGVRNLKMHFRILKNIDKIDTGV